MKLFFSLLLYYLVGEILIPLLVEGAKQSGLIPILLHNTSPACSVVVNELLCKSSFKLLKHILIDKLTFSFNNHTFGCA